MERKRKQIYFVSNIIYDADEIHKFHWTALKTLHTLGDRGFPDQNIIMVIISSKDVALIVLICLKPLQPISKFQHQQPRKATLTLIGAAHQQFSVLVEL